jgi:NitT/TauT family transport system substrate-binding protein
MTFSHLPLRRLISALLSFIATAAAAEPSEIRVAQQFGLPYLPLVIAKHQRLIEKNAAAAGLKDLAVTWVRLGGGAAANDALLSGSADFAGAGIAPVLIIHDRTRANLDVRAVAGLDASSAYLNTINPAVKSLRDFGDKDRIAVPSIKVSIQAVWLQIAAEKLWGPGQEGRLDRLTVALPHPEATAALLSGKSEVTAHFATAPFSFRQLADPKVRKVTTSEEILGGPASNTFVFTTSKFRTANPKAYRAVFDAVREAQDLIARDPAAAARIFADEEQGGKNVEDVLKILADPATRYSLAPLNTYKIADFLARTGTLKAKPASWKDYTFPELHGLAGS